MMVKVTPRVQALRQPLATCCWFTCLEMLFNWKNAKGDKSKKASMILSEMDKSPNLYPDYMMNAGIAPGECRETARMLGLRASGDTAQLDAGILAEMLKNHGPLWIAGRWYRNFNHVIVLTGCDPDSGQVKYVDPWDNPDLSESSNSVGYLSKRGPVWTNCDASIMYWP